MSVSATVRLLCIDGTDLGAAETVSGREHHRDGRGKPGGYSEKRTRAPKRKREEGERREFQVVHIARAGKRAMERMAGLPTGDG